MMENTPPLSGNPAADPDIARLETLASFLDNRFRIPGTNIRFGLDALMGLVPYLGDIAGFAVSGFLFTVLLKRGAGPVVLVRMMGNFALDAAVGTVPLLGDLFDFGFKANRRNVELLKRYYADDAPKPGVGASVLILVCLFLLFLAVLVWLTGKLLLSAWHSLSGWLG